MNSRRDYEDFREIVRDMVKDLVDEILKDENLYISHTGTIINKENIANNENNPFLFDKFRLHPSALR